MLSILAFLLHPVLDIHEDEAFEAELPRLRLDLEELIHFFWNSQFHSNRDLLHSVPARTIGENTPRVKISARSVMSQPVDRPLGTRYD
jgi:hypothetical protein